MKCIFFIFTLCLFIEKRLFNLHNAFAKNKYFRAIMKAKYDELQMGRISMNYKYFPRLNHIKSLGISGFYIIFVDMNQNLLNQL